MELDAGAPGESFSMLQKGVAAELSELCRGVNVVMIHNVLTMPFHLAWTASLWQLASELKDVRFIGWVHDLAARNVDYRFPTLPENLGAALLPRIRSSNTSRSPSCGNVSLWS